MKRVNIKPVIMLDVMKCFSIETGDLFANFAILETD